LRPELARRQEIIASIEKQKRNLEELSIAQSKVAQQTLSASKPFEKLQPLEEEAVRRGQFSSPIIAQQNLLEQQRDITQSILLSRPDLIDSIDDLGNVTLRSAAAFDELAGAASNAQKVLFNLTQIKVAEGFAQDLDPKTGFFGGIIRGLDDLTRGTIFDFLIPDDAFRNAGNKFKDSLDEFATVLNSDLVREARRLKIPLELIDEDGAKDVRKKAENFIKKSLDFRALSKQVDDQISKLQPDAGQLEFQLLGANLESFFKLRARQLSLDLGSDVSPVDIINRQFLQNRSSLKGATDFVGFSAEETIDRFREAGFASQLIDVQSDVEKEFKRLKGGELVLFTDIQGITQQATLEITRSGKLQLRQVADALGNFATQSLQDVLDTSSTGLRI